MYVAWALSVIAAFWVGYYFRGLAKTIETLKEEVKTKVNKEPESGEPKSTLIDPDDEVQTALYEHNRMMERLNGKDN